MLGTKAKWADLKMSKSKKRKLKEKERKLKEIAKEKAAKEKERIEANKEPSLMESLDEMLQNKNREVLAFRYLRKFDFPLKTKELR